MESEVLPESDDSAARLQLGGLDNALLVWRFQHEWMELPADDDGGDMVDVKGAVANEINPQNGTGPAESSQEAHPAIEPLTHKLKAPIANGAEQLAEVADGQQTPADVTAMSDSQSQRPS